MSKKINIAFLAPETKGGPYYIYRDIVAYFKQQYSAEINVYFFHSKIDWLKLHFCEYDVICSVIPFLFKPFNAKTFIYNPRGNFEIEKKKNNLGNKLLYLAKNNLAFADRVWLNSYFLADKLNFKLKYEDKIFISPDFIDLKGINGVEKKYPDTEDLKILTVSSTKFLEKAMGLIDLKKQFSEITNKNVEWTIIAGGNDRNTQKIKDMCDIISVGDNIRIKWIDWVERDNLNTYYKNADIFLYATGLETWGGVIMEAMSFGLPVILLDYELWKYIYSDKIITDDIASQINDIEDNYRQYSKLSIDFVQDFEREQVIQDLKKYLLKK